MKKKLRLSLKKKKNSKKLSPRLRLKKNLKNNKNRTTKRRKFINLRTIYCPNSSKNNTRRKILRRKLESSG